MNPITAVQDIQKHLQDYIRKTLPIERALPELQEPLEKLFKEYPLAQDPFLELMQGYELGDSLQELVTQKVIYPETAGIFAQFFRGEGAEPKDVKLYLHQTEALKAVCQQDKNLVVCSGTGSGKTECFLIPLINYLVGEWIRSGRPDRLESGVQAMILYPMNALVNDQIRRLRQILKYAPFIRFGKYTGELESLDQEKGLRSQLEDNVSEHSNALNQAADGVDFSGVGFDDEIPLSNEVSRRSQWHNQPANILVTNYSMLERLLLQPETSNLFENPWKFIILDEAHCYEGALGTEIAWLVRRLKRRLGNPKGLRYLATSATLIDDSKLHDSEKALKISEIFASKLFPASPDSFCVQFGTPQSQTAVNNPITIQQPLNGNDFIKLIEDKMSEDEKGNLTRSLGPFETLILDNEDQSLFAVTQRLLGAERMNNHLEAAAKLAEKFSQEGPAVAIGDALYLLQRIQDMVDANLIDLEFNQKGLLCNDETTRNSIRALLNFVRAGVGPFNNFDYWRRWLHDHSDPRPSSQANDNQKDRQFQRRLGNRLHLLAEWQSVSNGNGDMGQLSLEGIYYLLFVADQLAVQVGQQLVRDLPPVGQIGVSLSQVAIDVITLFLKERVVLTQSLQNARNTIADCWKNRLGAYAQEEIQFETGGIELLLARFLGEVPCIKELSGYLQQAMRNDKADEATFNNAAAKLFGEEYQEDDKRVRSLDALISLGNLAVHPQTRRPLLDLRFHQLVRGLREVGVSFNASFEPTVRLHHSDVLTATTEEGSERAVFNLGACRVCGQPYAMGYSNLQNLTAGGAGNNTILSRIKTERTPYLHAIAWKPGAEYDGEDGYQQPTQINNLWLNIKTGKVIQGNPPPPDNDWTQCYWYINPEPNNSEFLKECPCCGESQNNDERIRYGLITPYEAKGEQFKLVLLDELVRKTEPSFDPSQRRQPGNGRKVLAFSDSRRGAATLAYRYQELFNELTVSRLIPEAVNMTQSEPMDQELFQELRRQTLSANPSIENMPEPLKEQNIQYYVNEYVKSLKGQAIALKILLERKNCGRLLEMSGANGGDLGSIEASQIRLLQGLRKRGRNAILRRGLVTIDNQQLNIDWNQLANDIAGGVQPNCLQRLYLNILCWLFENVELDLPAAWPPDGINSRFHKVVVFDRPAQAKNHETRFDSKGGTSGLNRIVRQALNLPNNTQGREKAMQVLACLWPSFAQGNSAVLTDIGNGIYAFKLDSLRLGVPSEGDLPNAGEQPVDSDVGEAWEWYESYLVERDIVPTRIEEHTAQIAKKLGAAYQKAFARGKLNILSCSTTFEMGVDLGDLACVFLTNLPPSVANYRQRAGRAGRRPGSAAYVLSFVGDTPHEQYYFDRPAKLLFGKVEPPKIYLENKIYRARHLRAEALHHFLKCFEPQVNGEKHPDGEGVAIQRKWSMAGHFFVGRMGVPGGGNANGRITATFSPIVADLPGWAEMNRAEVDRYISEICLSEDQPIGKLGYSVVADLIWQLRKQDNLADCTHPYPLTSDNQIHYAELAGPNQPQIDQERLVLSLNPSRQSVETRICTLYDSLGAEYGDRHAITPPAALSSLQLHLLSESTITWLSRNRILPKYGFPVDVIDLHPHKNDPYGGDVVLNRDLKIGLYEYAPGQIVLANKRVYESRATKVLLPGGFAVALDQAREMFLCESCRQPHENSGGKCIVCGDRVSIEAHRVVQPDAFQAERSRAGSNDRKPQRGTPLKIYTGGTRNIREVTALNLLTAESETNSLLYLNFGPNYRGFEQGNNHYSLFHEGAEGILSMGMSLQGMMTSALEALRRAIALDLEIAEREIGGATYPDQNRLGFVLFDESSGGGGAVLPLALSGDRTIDADRIKLIRRIIERAISLCRECTECNAQQDFGSIDLSLPSVSRLDWLAANPQEQAAKRVRQSCYKCLRSYSNQRLHAQLDRGDAVIVLEALLNTETEPNPPRESVRVCCREIPACDRFTLAQRPRGMPRNSTPEFERIPPNAPLNGTVTGLVLLDGQEYVVGRILQTNGGFRYMPGNIEDGLQSQQIERNQIIARLSKDDK
jgi:hypothetical protein